MVIDFGQRCIAATPAYQWDLRKRTPRIIGILVFYRAKLTETENAQIQKLNGRFQLKRSPTLEHFNLDILSDYQQKQLNSEQIARLCRHYTDLPWVEKCVGNYESLPETTTPRSQLDKSSASCSPPPATLSQSSLTELLSLAAATSTDKCHLLETAGLPPKLNGTLSPLWAQEYIGADLAKETLREIAHEKAVPFAVFDSFSPDNTHGRICSSLASANSLFSASEIGQVREFKVGNSGEYFVAVNEILKETGNPIFQFPKLVTNSQLWFSQETPKAMQKLADRGTIIVAGSGNGFPEPMEEPRRTFDPAIFVGSSSPFGTPSEFSQEAPNVTILAPSDEHLQSFIGTFGGTSGATPLVSGALLNVLALLPHLTHQDAKTLLKRTAIRATAGGNTTSFNGTGILNAYKILKVAQKVAESCKKSETIVDCTHQLINDSKTYQFESPQNERELLQEVALQFPGCGWSDAAPKYANLQASQSCVKKKDLLKTLRRSAFLADQEVPASRPLWMALSCIHHKLGLPTNALFYSIIANDGPSRDLVERAIEGTVFNKSLSISIIRGINPTQPGNIALLDQLMRTPDPNKRLERTVAALKLARLGESGVQLLHRAFSDANRNAKLAIAEISPTLGEQGRPFIELALQDSDKNVRDAAQSNLHKLGKEGIPYLRHLLGHVDKDVRSASLYTLLWLGEKDMPLLDLALRDSNSAIRELASSALIELGDAGAPLLDLAFLDSNDVVRLRATQALRRVGEKGLPLVERALTNPNNEIRHNAASLISLFGEKGLPLIERALKDEDYTVRKYAADALKTFGKDRIKPVERALRDPDPNTRAVVISMIKDFIDEADMDFLNRTSHNLYWDIRKQLAHDLPKLGPKSIPLLDRLSGDRVPDVRRAAALSLKEVAKMGVPLTPELQTRMQAILDEE